MGPSQFYTGLVAGLYSDLRGHVYDDPAPWEALILEAGQPALELGCGDGDPLLALRERGLDVEGVDSSPDMVARCRAAAAERGLTVTVHHQAMQTSGSTVASGASSWRDRPSTSSRMTTPRSQRYGRSERISPRMVRR